MRDLSKKVEEEAGAGMNSGSIVIVILVTENADITVTLRQTTQEIAATE